MLDDIGSSLGGKRETAACGKDRGNTCLSLSRKESAGLVNTSKPCVGREFPLPIRRVAAPETNGSD